MALRQPSLLVAATLLAVAPAHAWILPVPPGGFGVGGAVATDAAGDVFARGDAGGRNRIARFDGATGALLWNVEIGEQMDFALGALIVAPNGDPIAAGSEDFGATADAYVVRLAGIMGAEVWRYEIPASAAAIGSAVVMDTAGDVIAGASTTADFNTYSFTVVKLGSATGNELWREDVSGLTGVSYPLALALTATGDVVAAGLANDESFFVIRLDGATGAEEWRFIEGMVIPDLETVNIAGSVAVDPAGDIVVGGSIEEGGSDNVNDFTAVKLAGADGTEIWRHGIADTISMARIVLDGAGDVIATHTFGVLKLDGATGGSLWTRPVLGVRPPRVTEGGDVIVSGESNAYRIDGVTGAPEWSLSFGKSPTNFDSREPLIALDESDAVAVTGRVARGSDNPIYEFVAGSFSDRVTGTKLVLREAGSPVIGKLKVKSKDPRLAVSGPEEGMFSLGLGDPTVGGGTLTLVNPTSGETVTWPLPAAGWTAGRANGFVAAAYQYKDPAGVYGPCRSVSLRSGKKLSISCSSAALGFSLDEATQGSLGVRLTTGAGLAGEGFRYCLLFGGDVLEDRPGLFKASAAPAPDSCPGLT